MGPRCHRCGCWARPHVVRPPPANTWNQPTGPARRQGTRGPTARPAVGARTEAARPTRARSGPDGAGVRELADRGDAHGRARVRRVDHLAAADVDADVADRAVEEDQVTRLQV